MFFATLASTLILSACGGGGGGGGGLPTTGPEKVFDPWERVGGAFLPEEGDAVTETVRVLEFGDGMRISYDGSDAAGEERVCRREENEGSWHEACMPLEDDPYLVLLPNSAFVWHPLMFDRFATDLICRSWVGPEAGGDAVVAEKICDREFFEKMGGVDFNCEAGVVNGDRALKCSDDWAVSVNGEEDDTKSVCRVHIGNGSGRCLGAPKEGVADKELILDLQKTSWEGYRSVWDNPRQFVAGDSAGALPPQELPGGAKLNYRSRNTEICTVDDDDSDGGLGLVAISGTATPPTVCKVVLRVVATGFADRVLIARLPVLKPNDTAWADYERINNYFYPGENLATGAVTSGAPAMVETRYDTLDESVCTVDGESGEVAAVAPGECVVRLTAKAEHYLDVIIEKTVRVDALKQFADIAWNEFPSSARVGTDTPPLATPIVQDASGAPMASGDLTVTITTVSEGCAYDHASRILSFVDEGECSVSVTASGPRGYAEQVGTFTVTPEEGRFNLAWSGYSGGNSATFASPPPNLENPVTTPNLAEAIYTYTATGGACEVDPNSGTLTLLGATVETSLTCTVTVNASHDGYRDESTSQSVTINKAAQNPRPSFQPLW